MKKYLATDGADEPRYELKMVAQEATYDLVRSALNRHAEGIKTLFPDRRVQSLYLDTPFNRALEENLAGVNHREKLRFRWYGDAATNVKGRLENKVRHDTVGWKQIEPIEGLDVAGIKRSRFMARLRASVRGPLLPLVHGPLEPVQWISYRRAYLVTADGAIRITLDRHLTAWDQRGRFVLSNRFASLMPKVLIVEVKCARAHYQRARLLIERLPLVVGKCSKFVLASSLDEGPLLAAHY